MMLMRRHDIRRQAMAFFWFCSFLLAIFSQQQQPICSNIVVKAFSLTTTSIPKRHHQLDSLRTPLSSSLSPSLTTTSVSRLFALQEWKDQMDMDSVYQEKPSAFYDIDYDDDDDDDENSERDDDVIDGNAANNNDIDYDIDYDDDDSNDNNMLQQPFARRDEEEILTEKEDRFYQDPRQRKERCVLVGVEDVGRQRRDHDHMEFTLDESMNEMRELIKTAGMELVAEITQRMPHVNPKTYIGTGKVQQAQELVQQYDCSTLVFDAELTPGQQKALENTLNRNLLQNDFLGNDREIKVIDRTALILDIFAQHAKTREGKLQVDLALHEYRKPRLTKLWTHLERQSAGGGGAGGSGGMGVVGLRGPGESQLEMDKRLLRDRILVLKEKINQVQKQRDLHRRGRRRTGLPILSLVGYTNAGKSTLLNTLTQAGVMAESMLFATLDPTTRKVQLPTSTFDGSTTTTSNNNNNNNGGGNSLMKTRPEVLLTDTVGFIQKLPTHLVAAFRATLEEVQYADVLLHVIDVSNPTWAKQEQAVLSVLRDIGCANDKPMIRILNKMDLLPPHEASYLCQTVAAQEAAAAAATSSSYSYPQPQQAPPPCYTVAVSALRGDGMEDFMAVVEEALSDLLLPIEVEIPYAKGEDLNMIHEQGSIETIDYRAGGTYVLARVPRSVANRVQQYSLVVEASSLSSAPLPTFAKMTESKLTSSSKDQQQEEEEEEEDWGAIGRGRHSAKRTL